MLKRRLEKLESAAISKKREMQTYFVRQDEERDRMGITSLGFFGTMEEGYSLMDQHPYDLFVIMNIPDDIDDEHSWNKATEQMTK